MTDLYALVSSYTPLRRTAGTDGGEFHGSCPFCGRGVDRLAVWPAATRPNWWCRQCGKRGDAIQFLREMGHSYADACRMLGEPTKERAAAPMIAPPADCEPPCAAWRTAGAAFVFYAVFQLSQAPHAVDYLHSRGLTDVTIAKFSIGYNPTSREASRAKWGLEPQDGDDRMWIPAGIVIPSYADNALWKIQIRRDEVPEGKDRYKTVTGSANALYGADSIRPARPAVLVEGPFDAMAVSQVAGDLCGVAASGTSGARRPRWYARLALASEVLVSLDADDAGDAAAHRWLDILSNGRRWRPSYADPAQMLQDGADVRGWLKVGLGLAELPIKPIHPELLDFWRFVVARQSTGHLDRLRALCAAQGASYDRTVEYLAALGAPEVVTE